MILLPKAVHRQLPRPKSCIRTTKTWMCGRSFLYAAVGDNLKVGRSVGESGNQMYVKVKKVLNVKSGVTLLRLASEIWKKAALATIFSRTQACIAVQTKLPKYGRVVGGSTSA